MNFHETKTLAERLELMSKISDPFLTRAEKIDLEGGFPFRNIEDLKNSGYTALTVPKKYGGMEISIFELVCLQEKIAEKDGATALSIGWHMGFIKNLSEYLTWEEDLFQKLCMEAKKGALVNAAATEPKTGSPTRGGKPQTTAEKQGKEWVIEGRKTFTTMSPILDYFIVSATIKDTDQVGNFLIHRSCPGVSIEETWDSLGMRGTGSHDLVLRNVKIQEECFVEAFKPGKKKPNASLLHIPSCYLGIAQAAQAYAIQFAKEYAPNSISGAIIDIATVQQRIGEMELELMKSRHFLYSVAKMWDSASKEERIKLQPELSAVKHAVTNSAIKVVDIAMRVVGAKSLSMQNPLQRYYRDVRAGLHNPPMDDMTIQTLASSAIQKQ
ncbi:acyl-CoA dehydrogenase family protein [Bacillus sp. 03113]|uniref:acyl-CoA dehydrogenase family protein n=1 Tax=Bacillus sp. 03113 TaxID=2578211 RepID=UPI00215C4751|nr:acyl-CoA dehydrogenase family protein [Bacillus sp. 03113]